MFFDKKDIDAAVNLLLMLISAPATVPILTTACAINHPHESLKKDWDNVSRASQHGFFSKDTVVVSTPKEQSAYGHTLKKN